MTLPATLSANNPPRRRRARERGALAHDVRPARSTVRRKVRPRGRPSRLTSLRAIAKAERMAEALAYRRLGHTYEVIAGWMGTSRGYVYDLVSDALRAAVQEPAEEVRQLELERLDGMLTGVMGTALEGDLQAITAVLKITDRRLALLGLDTPRKVAGEISGTATDARASLARKLAELQAGVGLVRGKERR